jgi:hypothetical protein
MGRIMAVTAIRATTPPRLITRGLLSALSGGGNSGLEQASFGLVFAVHRPYDGMTGALACLRVQEKAPRRDNARLSAPMRSGWAQTAHHRRG